jgi:ribose transport system permease protein
MFARRVGSLRVLSSSSRIAMSGLRPGGRKLASAPILAATIGLFALSPLLASGSLGAGSVNNMLPFAAALAITAVGQTLVIQQGGIDLSVPGMVSLGAVVFTKHADGSDGAITTAILLVLVCGLAIGLLNGLVVTRLRVTPLVATLAANALLLGGVQQISGGVPTSAPSSWSDFALGKAMGVPHTVIIALVVIVVVAIVVKRTVVGRQFEATGENDLAARAAGIRVATMKISAYVAAAVLSGCAGVLLAGILHSPSLFVGDTYLLSSIAATVLGGTPLTGGAASVIATGIGALFLSQLNQVLAATGAETSVQLLVQGAVIAVSVALTNLDWRPRWSRARAPSGPGGDAAVLAGGNGPPLSSVAPSENRVLR